MNAIRRVGYRHGYEGKPRYSHREGRRAYGSDLLDGEYVAGYEAGVEQAAKDAKKRNEHLNHNLRPNR